MIPAFSAAISAISVPRYSVWSTPIGVMTATGASTTLVASHRPPMPTSTTATSIGRIGEGGEGHRRDDLELAHRRAACRFGLLVDEVDERLDLRYVATYCAG